MLKKLISRVFIIIAAIASFQILSTIILARYLPKPDMGLYRLILTIAEIGSLISLMGIDHSLVRFFSSSAVSINQYDWKKFLKSFSLIPLFIIITLLLIVSPIYKFSPFVIAGLFIILIMLTYIFIFASLLRAGHRYELSIFLSRLNFIIFFLVLAGLYIFKNISFRNALLGYVLAATLANFIVIFFNVRNIPSGKNPIPASVLKNGFYYFGLGVAVLLITQTGFLMMGKMLTYKDIAVYAIIASTMRLFEFAQDSSYYVLAPYLNKETHIPKRKIFLRLFLVAMAIAVFYIFFAKPLIHFLFKGNYDEGIYLVRFFIGIGIVRTLFILPASIVGGRSSEGTLRNLFYLMISAAVFNIFLSYAMINKMGLTGAALASLITWTLLTSGSFFLIAKPVKK